MTQHADPHQPDAALLQAPEAEQSVLGALMLDPDAMLRLADAPLKAEHFADVAHRAIWSAIFELQARHELIDPITVYDVLRDRGFDEACGGLPYLHELTQSVPSAAHIARHAGILREKALHRVVLEAADRSLSLARMPGSAAAKLDQIQTLFANVQRPSAHRAPRPLGELVADRLQHWEALQAGDTRPGMLVQLGDVDEALAGGLKPGKVYVLAARPSVGKTSLAQQIGATVAGQGYPVFFASQEMTAGELVDRHAANAGGIPLDHAASGALDELDWTSATQVADEAGRLPFYVSDEPALTLLDIRSKARAVQQREGRLGLVIVDYLQLCGSDLPADRRHHQIEAISRGLKQLAKELDCAVLALSQLNRKSTQREDGEPELYDLKESGAIEEDADVVLLMHAVRLEPDKRMLVLLKVAKNRGGKRCRLGLLFDGRYQRWDATSADVSRGKR